MRFQLMALLASTAVSAQILCTANINISPLAWDCLAAYGDLPPANGEAVSCKDIYAARWTLAERGACRIEGYSSLGRAACLDRKAVLDAGIKIFQNCVVGGVKGTGYVEGGAEIKGERGVFEGVRFIPVPKKG